MEEKTVKQLKVFAKEQSQRAKKAKEQRKSLPKSRVLKDILEWLK